MKIFKRIAATVAVIALLTSCSLVRNVTSNAKSTGINTGQAILSLYQILKSTGTIDLSNLTNIINLGKILTGANALSDATASFTDQFISGLIKGSSDLINDANVSKVMSALKTLSSIDTAAISQAADRAASGAATQLTNSTAGVAATLSQLNSIFKLFN